MERYKYSNDKIYIKNECCRAKIYTECKMAKMKLHMCRIQTLGIVVVKTPRFEGLENLNIPNIGREPIPGVVYTVNKNVCLKILVFHLYGKIAGESDDLKGVLHPWTLF